MNFLHCFKTDEVVRPDLKALGESFSAFERVLRKHVHDKFGVMNF